MSASGGMFKTARWSAIKKASNLAASSFWMKDIRCLRLKLASGYEPGYRQAPVCRLTGRMNAVRWSCFFSAMFAA